MSRVRWQFIYVLLAVIGIAGISHPLSSRYQHGTYEALEFDRVYKAVSDAVSFPLLAPLGTLTDPSYSFSGYTGTGLTMTAPDFMTMVINGTKVFSVGSSSATSTVPFVAPAGTFAAPSYSFAGDLTDGMYRNDVNSIGFAINGATRAIVDNAGFGIGADGDSTNPSLFWTGDQNTGFYHHAADAIGVTLSAETGMCIFRTSGFVTGLAGTYNIGSATEYFGDISYKTLTDRGCLGWFDGGVEMPDGSKVTDVEALKLIKVDPTKETVYGVPMLDYKTFPVVAYKQASVVRTLADGTTTQVMLPRDANDNPYDIGKDGKVIPAADGVEMTSMFSIMIGAIKELDAKNAVLEARISKLEGK